MRQNSVRPTNMRPESQARVDRLDGTMEDIVSTYVASENRKDEGFVTIDVIKENANNVRGYVGMDFLISTEKADELQKTLLELYDKKRGVIPPDIRPVFARAGYQISNGDGTFRDDPDHEVMRFILELNKGDYEALEHPLTEKEEDGMRQNPSAKDLYEAEREEEKRMGILRHH